jgi:hypothetical protein
MSLLGDWNTMSLEEKVETLRQSKAEYAQLRRLAEGVDRFSIETMACIAVLGAMAERSAPNPTRVKAWCAAIRNAAPRVSEFDLEASAKKILQLLGPIMNRAPE